MNETKNLSVVLPIELHSKFTSDRIEKGYANNSDYITELLEEYYEMIKNGGKTMIEENVRTLAIQISPELMDRLDAHIKKIGAKKKTFLTQLIEKALDDAESQNEGE